MLFNGVSPSIIEMSLSTGIESTMAFNVTRLHGSFFGLFAISYRGLSQDLLDTNRMGLNNPQVVGHSNVGHSYGIDGPFGLINYLLNSVWFPMGTWNFSEGRHPEGDRTSAIHHRRHPWTDSLILQPSHSGSKNWDLYQPGQDMHMNMFFLRISRVSIYRLAIVCVMAKIGRLMGELYMIVSRRQSLTAAHFRSQTQKEGSGEMVCWPLETSKLEA